MIFTIESSELQREAIYEMSQPTVLVYEGVFISWNGGEPLGYGLARVDVVGGIPDNRIPCATTHDFNDSLLSVYAVNYIEMLEAIRGGFNAWSDLNTHLSLVHVEQDPLIQIDQIEYSPDHIGLACIYCLVYGASMDVSIYDYNCHDERIHHEPDYVRNIIAHELGHMLGLVHQGNKTHLMYGPEHIQDPYLALDYTIPDQLPESFIGERAMRGQLADLDMALDEMTAELDKPDAAIERYEDRHVVSRSGSTVYFDTQSEANRYSRMIRKYNELADECTAIVNEYNDMTDELNRMYEQPNQNGGI